MLLTTTFKIIKTFTVYSLPIITTLTKMSIPCLQKIGKPIIIFFLMKDFSFFDKNSVKKMVKFCAINFIVPNTLKLLSH